MMSSQGLVIAATAMAVSGTVVLFTLCRQKHLLLSLAPLSLDPTAQPQASLSLRPCIKSSSSMDGEKRRREKNRRKKKNGKKVQFSDRVEEFYFQAEAPRRKSVEETASCRVRSQMPANQMALYRGILRDRVHRIPAYSY